MGVGGWPLFPVLAALGFLLGVVQRQPRPHEFVWGGPADCAILHTGPLALRTRLQVRYAVRIRLSPLEGTGFEPSVPLAD
jgi:hypothetical protein